eukprot:c21369_g1_i5 orf=199-378(+)
MPNVQEPHQWCPETQPLNWLTLQALKILWLGRLYSFLHNELVRGSLAWGLLQKRLILEP